MGSNHFISVAPRIGDLQLEEAPRQARINRLRILHLEPLHARRHTVCDTVATLCVCAVQGDPVPVGELEPTTV